MKRRCYVGLMSGTSLDGVDAVVVQFSQSGLAIRGSAYRAFDAALRDELLALTTTGPDELARAARAGNVLARLYAATVREALATCGAKAEDIAAVGCHGQTVRHRPGEGYTIQIGNAALLAELTGIAVVSDFRSRDVAARGQGAPLVPGFHAAMFAAANEDRVVLNLGGIANVSILGRHGDVLGFDTGPGNCLMDFWAARHLGEPFDRDGSWAASGRPLPRMLEAMLRERYFHAPPPKSTGRDLFDGAWLRRHVPATATDTDTRDVQATLLELTAQSVARAIEAYRAQRVIVCGGGTRNRALLARLTELVAPAVVEPSDRHGLEAQLVEATAFAWLARQALEAKPGNLPAVTGARGPRVLGAIYPA